MIDKRIGILGGGQLGKMLCTAGAGMSLTMSVMDKEKGFPADLVCTDYHTGDITDYEDVIRFGKSVDILTIEFEKINVEALKVLEEKGVKVWPSPSIIAMIQDKGTQKEFYHKNRIPTSDFHLLKDKSEVLEAIQDGNISYPFVQKTRRDGYDGQGVMVCKGKDDLIQIFDAPCLVENLVDIDKEIAVIVCRNEKGEMAIYDPVEMIFDPMANLLDYQLAPANIDMDTILRANDLVYKIATELNLIGILAIEMFLDKNGKLLINEMAPRPHNSGHHTIEACHTSQYENHLRAILNLPLGNPGIICPSVLINLLGSEGYKGDIHYQGVSEILCVSGANLHLYGKKSTKPFRKVGHVTLLHENEEIPYNSINKIKEVFRTSPLINE